MLLTEHIRTQSKDHDFHSQRRMFAIVDGTLSVAPAASVLSHIEWFEQEGWVQSDQQDIFLDKTPRGFYLSHTNEMFIYQGNGFFFSPELETAVIDALPLLVSSLHLNENTKVHLGPKDSVVNGKSYPQKYLGKVSELLG